MAISTTPIIYSDCRTDFAAHPVTGDLVMVTNEAAVIQSVKNLIMTNNWERETSGIGGNVKGALFELPSIIAEDVLRGRILMAINNYERRAKVIEVYVSMRPDADAYAVRVVFMAANVNRPIVINTLLERLR